MHNYYVINNTVEFHPATSTLTQLDNPGNIVIINSPASRCLLLMIQRCGSIVSQHDFMNEVWGKCGAQISSNTYYQNISILRKGLKKIGLGESVIVTIPRVGLTLASDVKIDVNTHESKTDTHKINGDINRKIDANNVISYSELTKDELEPLNLLPKEELNKTDTLAEQSKIALCTQPDCCDIAVKKSVIKLCILFAVAGLSASGIMIMKPKTYQSYYEDYQDIGIDAPCHFFLERDLSSSEKNEITDKFVPLLKERCDKYPNLYITTKPLLPRVSVISCTNPITIPGSCISDFFIKDK